MRIFDADQARAFDEWAIGTVGLPPLVLMENASRRVVDEILRLRARGEVDGSRSLRILCGPGNNGGDGVAVARLLAAEGIRVQTHLLGDPREGSDLEQQIEIARALDLDIRSGAPSSAELDAVGLWVDSLFGTGLSRPLEGVYADLVRAVNGTDGPVLAVDLPSGLDANRGTIIGPTINALCTVTFPLSKLAHHLYPAAQRCGRVVVGSLGVPPGPVSGPEVHGLETRSIARELPTRPPDAHKGTFGRVLVVAGSLGLEGAAVLAASAAVTGGAGLVRLAVPSACRSTLQIRPEVMVQGVGDADSGCFTPDDLSAVLELAEGQDALVLGPGIGTSARSLEFAGELLSRWSGSVVVDADALRALPESGFCEAKPMVLTPHPGELARLLGRSVDEMTADPLGSAGETAEHWCASVVLKGRSTVVAAPGQIAWIDTGGGPLLASGGSGDVLAGLLGALLAAGLDPPTAARCGVHVHGLAADRLTARRSRVGLGATAICAELPDALEACYARLEGKHENSLADGHR